MITRKNMAMRARQESGQPSRILKSPIRDSRGSLGQRIYFPLADDGGKGVN